MIGALIFSSLITAQPISSDLDHYLSIQTMGFARIESSVVSIESIKWHRVERPADLLSLFDIFEEESARISEQCELLARNYRSLNQGERVDEHVVEPSGYCDEISKRLRDFFASQVSQSENGFVAKNFFYEAHMRQISMRFSELKNKGLEVLSPLFLRLGFWNPIFVKTSQGFQGPEAIVKELLDQAFVQPIAILYEISRLMRPFSCQALDEYVNWRIGLEAPAMLAFQQGYANDLGFRFFPRLDIPVVPFDSQSLRKVVVLKNDGLLFEFASKSSDPNELALILGLTNSFEFPSSDTRFFVIQEIVRLGRELPSGAILYFYEAFLNSDGPKEFSDFAWANDRLGLRFQNKLLLFQILSDADESWGEVVRALVNRPQEYDIGFLCSDSNDFLVSFIDEWDGSDGATELLQSIWESARVDCSSEFSIRRMLINGVRG